MNATIEPPTKVIRLDPATYRIAPESSEKRGRGPRGLLAEAQNAKRCCDIDFYAYDMDEEQLCSESGSVMDFTDIAGEEYGKPAEEADSATIPASAVAGASTIPDNPSSELEQELVLKQEFFKLSLRHDLRVQSFKLFGPFFYIRFWSLEDAVSYYRQYFKLVEMRFADVAESMFSPMEHLASPSREHHGQSASAFAEQPWGYAFNAWGDQTTSSTPQVNLSDQKMAYGIASICDVSDSSNPVPNGSARCCPATYLGGAKQPAHNSATDAADNVPVCSVIPASWDTERSASKTSIMSMSSAGDPAAAPEYNGSTVPCVKDTGDRSKFLLRVEYFNKMRNFFSKNDVKKMQALVDEGRYSFLYLNSKEISCGCFSNVIMQNVVKSLDEDSLCEIIRNLGSDIAPIAATKHGAYTVQTIILCAATARSQRLVSRYFEQHGRHLFGHAIGNYAIQKIVRFDEGFVYEMCMGSLPAILECALSLKVFRRCLEFFSGRFAEIRARLAEVENERNADKCRLVGQLMEELDYQ
ncbi:hypothetical protein PAPHI01_1792 [Pancytospora philotis]|nr:hypothetical protein PAPHI01_1792 [Pancytospora philotis]